MSAVTPSARTPRDEAALLALDWGSTHVRAYLLDHQGKVLAERRGDAGASRVPRGGFEAAYRALVGDWLGLGLPALACGMVGSAHGWVEAAYVACPARPQQLAAILALAGTGDAQVHIVPGLCVDSPLTPDVMRGEETQVFGLLHLHPDLAGDCTLVMPGTHSKWVRVSEGVVTGFATRMTGEMYAVLREHSVLGRLMAASADATAPEWAAFERGVAAAREGGAGDLLHRLFGIRAFGLRGGLAPAEQADYLSGLLVGAEMMAGLAAAAPGSPLGLVGDPALCERYARALQAWGLTARRFDDTATVAGLWAVAHAAGLVGSGTGRRQGELQ